MTAYRWGRRLATTWVVAGGALALLAIIAVLVMLFAMATSNSNPFQTYFASRLIVPYIGAALLGIGIVLSGFVARAVFDIADRKRA